MKQHDLATGFDLALTNYQVILGAIKRAGVYRYNSWYEDLVQEGYLTYAFTWTQVELEGDLFNHYVFQRLIWRTQDFLRRERYRQDHSDVDDLNLKVEPEVGISWQLAQVLPTLLPHLTNIEQVILAKHFLQQQKLAPLAHTLGVSPRYLRQVRSKLRLKLKELLN